MEKKNVELISPQILMGMIGALAIAMPIVVYLVSIIFGPCDGIQSSISAYYHTVARNAFVGILCALAFAFFSYKGYDTGEKLNDSICGNLAAIFALLVAFCPTSIGEKEKSNCITSIIDNGIINIIHHTAASLLFITLAYFCFCQFTKSESGNYWNKTQRAGFKPTKLRDNKLYIICGWIIVIFMVLTLIVMNFLHGDFEKEILKYRPVYLFETIMIATFGIAWLHKGRYFNLIERD